MVEICEIRALVSTLVIYKKDDGEKVNEWFYVDIGKNEVMYAITPTLPVAEDVKQAIFDHIRGHTPSITIPTMPERPDYSPENFTYNSTKEE